MNDALRIKHSGPYGRIPHFAIRIPSGTQLYPRMFTGLFSLPAHPLHQRMVQPNRPGRRAHGDTTPTVPTFVGVEYDRGFVLLRIWDKHIHLANIHTHITTDTSVSVEYHRPVGSGCIRGCENLFFNHLILLRFSLL